MDSLNGFAVFVQVAETRSFVAAGRLWACRPPP
jgi:DNA-binding transcriptional LysR family regulator